MNKVLIIKLSASLSPEAAYYYFLKKEYFCFLDSSLSESKYSNFSYFCFEPDFLISNSKGISKRRCFKTGKVLIQKCHPLDFLDKNMESYINFPYSIEPEKTQLLFYDEINETFYKNNVTDNTRLPDFKGGFVGYFSYDLKNYLEKPPVTVIDDLRLPVFNLFFYRNVFSYDHKEQKWYFIKILNNSLRNKKQEEDFSLKDVRKVARKMSSLLENAKIYQKTEKVLITIAKKYEHLKINSINIHSNIKKENYLKNLLKIKTYIHDGEIYQANFTHRFACNMAVDAGDFYFILRKTNPAPFSAFLNFPECAVASTSPERFILLKNRYIETRPIKGTRQRGKNRLEDAFFRKELKNSIKDRAELNMIVDLERNDLGKFCDYGSIRVKNHAVIEKYARVFHLVSTVTGKIKKGTTFTKILKSVFPGGSITGAPKIRAMQIIDEVEKNARSIYTGSIGYISVDGMTDLNICIRTFIIKGNQFYYNTGGGIVEDSVPEDEYIETLHKGKALKEALKFFEYRNLKKVKI